MIKVNNSDKFYVDSYLSSKFSICETIKARSTRLACLLGWPDSEGWTDKSAGESPEGEAPWLLGSETLIREFPYTAIHLVEDDVSLSRARSLFATGTGIWTEPE